MRYIVRFSVEVEIESEAENDLGVVADAVCYCLKEEREQCSDMKVRPLHVEPMRDDE